MYFFLVFTKTSSREGKPLALSLERGSMQWAGVVCQWFRRGGGVKNQVVHHKAGKTMMLLPLWEMSERRIWSSCRRVIKLWCIQPLPSKIPPPPPTPHGWGFTWCPPSPMPYCRQEEKCGNIYLKYTLLHPWLHPSTPLLNRQQF